MANPNRNHQNQAPGTPPPPAVLGRVRASLQAGHERHLRPDGDRRQSRHPRRQSDHAHHLRLQLSRRSLRLLRHADQRQARMACSALVDNLEQPIQLEPFSKFPVVRDLAVDRSVLFENLKAVKAWVPVDGTYDLGSGPRVSPKSRSSYPLSRCISCCCCMEACPQFNETTDFVGAATISQVRLFNNHPTGKALKRERLTRPDGRRRHPGMRLRPKLRGSLPQRHPAHHLNRRRRRRCDEAGHHRPIPPLAQVARHA